MVRIDGLNQVIGRLDKVSGLAGVKSTLEGVAVHIAGKMKEYPPERHAPQAFVSDKQRRGFFYHLKQGDIEVPYRRGRSPQSESLKHRWTTHILDNGLTAVIGNNASYAQRVQDRDKQTRYHKQTGWKTVQDEIQSEHKLVSNAIEAAIRKSITE